MKEENHHHPLSTHPPEELLQELRLQANELLLREEWQQSIQVYTKFIDLCQNHISAGTYPNPDQTFKLQKSLCLALSNRAEAHFRLQDFTQALKDCDQALEIDDAHFKSLVCKGKILLLLNRFSTALDCFKTALLDPQAAVNPETLNGYVEKCKKLEFQSRTGAFDLSDWVLSGFSGKSPELAEYIGSVQIKKSDLSGRGLFATKNIDAGTLLLATKAIAIERGILASKEAVEDARLVMWKNFIDKVVKSTQRCKRIQLLVGELSTGEEEHNFEVPEIDLFRPQTQVMAESEQSNKELDMVKMMSILDANSLVENSILGKNRDYYGVGLWVVASFMNHSCNPNAKRLHVGDYMLVHASRDVKAGEEITFAYFDVLMPLEKRREMSNTWGFQCKCRRCKMEEQVICSNTQEIKEIEIGLERGLDVGSAVYRVEEGMKRWMVRGKEKGSLRASFWGSYCDAYSSEKVMKRWGRRLPAADVVMDSVAEAIGSDERVVKVLIQIIKRDDNDVVEMERLMRFGRGIYGKVVKKQALKYLLDRIQG